ncbi:hypothetical protein BKA62DRAFT_171700 [Auriculariales sp. MPI-PUGE-AT-0066]|nr:hypothetical protein BKA62DRAFT_171700 [Auriculariales sp. MPI-PUGE-AT-0066]
MLMIPIFLFIEDEDDDAVLESVISLPKPVLASLQVLSSDYVSYSTFSRIMRILADDCDRLDTLVISIIEDVSQDASDRSHLHRDLVEQIAELRCASLRYLDLTVEDGTLRVIGVLAQCFPSLRILDIHRGGIDGQESCQPLPMERALPLELLTDLMINLDSSQPQVETCIIASTRCLRHVSLSTIQLTSLRLIQQLTSITSISLGLDPGMQLRQHKLGVLDLVRQALGGLRNLCCLKLTGHLNASQLIDLLRALQRPLVAFCFSKGSLLATRTGYALTLEVVEAALGSVVVALGRLRVCGLPPEPHGVQVSCSASLGRLFANRRIRTARYESWESTARALM